MKFNNGLERKRFNDNWVKLRMEYLKAGMDEETINKMWKYDLEEYNSRRVFLERNQLFVSNTVQSNTEDETCDKLPYKYSERFSINPYEKDLSWEYSWLEEISNVDLYQCLKGLKEADIAILDLFAIQGYTVVEIARMQGKSHPVISRKIGRIKKLIHSRCLVNL